MERIASAGRGPAEAGVSLLRGWSLRARLLAAFAALVLPYVALGGVAGHGLRDLARMLGELQGEALGHAPQARIREAYFEVLYRAARLAPGGEAAQAEGLRAALAHADRMLAAELAARSLGARAPAPLLDAVDAAARRLREAVEMLLGQTPGSPGAAAGLGAVQARARDLAAAADALERARSGALQAEMERVAGATRRQVGATLLLLVGGVAGWLAVAPLLASWLSAPVRALARGSRRLATGDLAHRVEVRSGGELADAARAFNEMAEQLQRSYEALARSERRYRLLADNATDIIWTADLDLRLTYVTPSATAHLGYSVGELMGPWGDRFMPAAARRRLREAVERVLAREAAAGGPAAGEEPLELELTRRDGTPLWVEVRLSVLRDATDAPVGVLGASRDVTERHRLAQLKADFVALTTHQLRTPLAGMKWLLELAGEAPELTEDTRGYVRDVADQVDRLLEIVNNLLDGAQLESGAVRLAVAPTDLAALTEKVLADFEHAARTLGHAVSLAVEPGLPPVPADPQLLRQALTNLVGNAVKYTPAGGRIEVAIERCGDAARWQVRDSGIGVPATARPRLFEKFYRADNASRMAPEGTGLGLYLARLIVERLGGRIWCESEEGRGATFAFTLPLEGA